MKMETEKEYREQRGHVRSPPPLPCVNRAWNLHVTDLRGMWLKETTWGVPLVLSVKMVTILLLGGIFLSQPRPGRWSQAFLRIKLATQVGGNRNSLNGPLSVQLLEVIYQSSAVWLLTAQISDFTLSGLKCHVEFILSYSKCKNHSGFT